MTRPSGEQARPEGGGDARDGRLSASPRRGNDPPRPETEHSRRARFVWAGRIGGALVRAWGRTWRLEHEVPEAVRALEVAGRPYIHAFFHEHIFPLTYAYRDRGVVVLVSQSADGEYISQILHRLGSGTVRGSSSNGSLRALLTMARTGREGFPLAVTPDGPRGPRRAVQLGVLHIASRSGQPIVPLAAGVRHARRLRSWDRFEVPWPFSPIRIVAGEPLEVAADIEPRDLGPRYLGQLQSRLDEVEAKAEAFARGSTR